MHPFYPVQRKDTLAWKSGIWSSESLRGISPLDRLERATNVRLSNGEQASVGSFVALSPTPHTPLVAKIEEILRDTLGTLAVVMVTPVHIDTTSVVQPYRMPRVVLPSDNVALVHVPPQVSQLWH